MRHVALTILVSAVFLGACVSGEAPTSSTSVTGGNSASSGRASSSNGSSATGGSSSGGGSTSASSSGGSTTGNAGCLPTPDGGPSPYLGANCTGNEPCCDFVCNFSLNIGSCEPTCTRTADCPLPFTFCDTDAGQCTPAYCGNLQGRGFNEPCNLEDAGDGNCVAGVIVSISGGYLGVCTESGTVATGDDCGQNPLRDEPSQLCVRGDVCTYDTDPDNTVCARNCDADAGADAGCPGGKTCQPYWEGGDGFTACL